jgi:hypothetical protein
MHEINGAEHSGKPTGCVLLQQLSRVLSIRCSQELKAKHLSHGQYKLLDALDALALTHFQEVVINKTTRSAGIPYAIMCDVAVTFW